MTSTIRFSPVNDLFRLQREFDQLFNTLFPASATGNRKASDTTVWSPRADFVETADAFEIYVDLPGIPREDIEIQYHEGTLTVSGDRKTRHAEGKPTYLRQERTYGRFSRSFTLPETVDPNRIEATYEHGVLRIHLHKVKESKPHRITIS